MKLNMEMLKTWYDARDAREKVLVLLLGSALIYAIFSLFLLRPLENQNTIVQNELQEANNQIKIWQTQIGILQKIPKTPLYQEWLEHHKTLESLHTQYQTYLKESPSKQWANVIKTILASHRNVALIEIKNMPEISYKSSNVNLAKHQLFQQQLNVTVLSNYNDTIAYLEHLEKALPHIHWNKLDYTVTTYPLAKVQMEFSIIYDKTPS